MNMSDQDSKYADSLISQENLDALVNEAEALSSDMEDSRDLDLVSPEDIEKLLGGTSQTGEDSEFDLISQDDIDSLISGEELGGVISDSTQGGEDSLISQDDINALLSGGDTGSKTESTPVESDSELISQDDIEALLSGSDMGAASETEDESLISQDDIDSLLNSSDPEEPAATVVDTDDSSGLEDESLISQDDIDALLSGGDTSDDTSAIEEESLISQADIDNLLQDSGDDSGTPDVNVEEQLISQDDIDKLLSDDTPGATVSGMADAGAGESLVSQDEIDKLLNADLEETNDFPEEVSNQVILKEPEPAKKKADKKGRKSIVSSKWFIGVAAVVLVLIVTGISLTVFLTKKDVKTEETTIAENMPLETTDEIAGDPTEIQDDVVDATQVIIEMNDFVVPAPVSMKGVSYISLNISMEIVDVTSNPIKGYEPFFRNIVYEVLNNALLMQSEAGLIEADLIKMVRAALDNALSEGSVGKIDFLDFNVT